MFKIFEPEQLERVRGENLWSWIKDRVVFSEVQCNAHISFLSKEEALLFKDLLEHSYFIPTCYDHDHDDGLYYISFGSYSASKLAKLILPHVRRRALNRGKIQTVADNKNSKINVYAAGPMENENDSGYSSRVDFNKAVKETRLKVISPCDFDYNKNKDENGKLTGLREYKETHTIEEAYWYTRRAVLGDITAVDDVDCVVCYINDKIGYGTTGEASAAIVKARTCYAVCEPGFNPRRTNYWLVGIPIRYFEGWDKFAEFVKELE